MKSDIIEPSVRETVSGRLVPGKVISGTETGVEDTGARKTDFRYFGVKETVFTVSKCPNYLKMSSQYLKTSQLSQNGPRHCLIFTRALFNVTWNRVFLEILP